MSAAVTREIVVRAKRPGGFWSAGKFFPDAASTVEVTQAQFEQLVADRAKGFLEIRGEGLDDILEPGGVPRSAHEKLVEELERVRGELAAARTEAGTCRAQRDAAVAESDGLKAKVAELEAKLAEAARDVARTAETEGTPVVASAPVDAPVVEEQPKPKKKSG